MTDRENEKGRLVDFHRTMSEQLNARLSESPRFFGAVVLAITAYGYAVWNLKEVDESLRPQVLMIVSLVAYWAILWAIWYLAALGYAFRYLQNAQHRIEDVLEWYVFRPLKTGEPPEKIRRPKDLFWLLPGIYHAHLGGLLGISGFLFAVFYSKWDKTEACFLIAIAIVIELVWVILWNAHYVIKFRKEHVKAWIKRADERIKGLSV